MHSVPLLFIAAHNLYSTSYIGMVLPVPSALNIFQLMNHNPRGTLIHFIHANVWVFLDPSLQTPLLSLLPHGGYSCHPSENTAQLSLIHAP